MRRATTLFTTGLAVVAIAACGSSSHKSASAPSPTAITPSTSTSSPPASAGSSATSPEGHIVAIEADPSGQLRFMQSMVAARAGKTTIDFTNKAPLAHNLVLVDSSTRIVGQTP